LAYDFFPTSKEEITKQIKSVPKQTLDEILTVFAFLKQYDPKPLVMDKSSPRNVKIIRKLQAQFGDASNVAKKTKVRQIKLSYGNGSSGNRGVNNRGNAAEDVFLKDLQNWWKGDTKNIVPKNLTAIQDLDRTYGISKGDKFELIPEGANNTKRPLQFGESGISITNPKGSGFNVGKSISDITVKTSLKDPIYLSLKLGNTVTFFNVGVRTILTPDEIKSGSIKNINGKKLLKMFGIDDKKFCQVFTEGYSFVDNRAKANVSSIQNLLKSGIGYGYHIIHIFPKFVESLKMDQRMMEKASDIGQVTVYYGGLTGTGKRIDIAFSSSLYNFKLNIRDTQGHDGFPTRLMCDFTHA